MAHVAFCVSLRRAETVAGAGEELRCAGANCQVKGTFRSVEGSAASSGFCRFKSGVQGCGCGRVFQGIDHVTKRSSGSQRAQRGFLTLDEETFREE